MPNYTKPSIVVFRPLTPTLISANRVRQIGMTPTPNPNFGESGFGETGFGESCFGESGRHHTFPAMGQQKVLTSSSLQTPNKYTDTPLFIYNSLKNVALTQYCRLPRKSTAHYVEYSLWGRLWWCANCNVYCTR